MRHLSGWLLLAAAAALSGCEFMVNKEVSAASTSTGATGSSGATSSSGSSNGSSGTSASSGSSGGTSSGSGGCVYQHADLQQPGTCSPAIVPTPRTAFPTHGEPDSKSRCSGPCGANGEDDDELYPVASYCSGRTLTYNISGGLNGDAQEITESITNDVFMGQMFSDTDYGSALQICDPAAWKTAGGNPPGDLGLPSPAALIALINFGAVQQGVLDPEIGPPVGAVWAYSGSQPNSAWFVDFSDGTFGVRSVFSGTASVLCQRGLLANVAPTDHCSFPDGGGDCALTSNLGGTGLSFRLPFASPRSLGDALDYCNHLGDTCGKYRLPSYKELASLVNFTVQPTNTFVDGLGATYWSSTKLPNGGVMVISNVGASGGTPTGFVAQDTEQHEVLCVTGP